LKGNQLDEIPSEIGNLGNLIILNLENNNLISIPQEVCDLELKGTTITVDAGVICN